MCSVVERYCVREIGERVKENKARVLALQVTSKYIKDSEEIEKNVYLYLKEENVEIFVLADQTYSECCIDIVTAKHVEADMIVHIGDYACEQKDTKKFMFVRPRNEKEYCIDDEMVEGLVAKTGNSKIVISNVFRHYLRRECEKILFFEGFDTEFDYNDEKMKEYTMVLMHFESDSVVEIAWYVKNFALLKEVYFFCLDTKELKICEKKATYRVGMVESVRSPKTKNIGILLNYPALQSVTFSCAKLLAKFIESTNRSSLIVSIGRITPEKLANFQEVDVWVNIACVRTVEAVDNKLFIKKVITVNELIAALTDYKIVPSDHILAANNLSNLYRYLVQNSEEIEGLCREGRLAANEGESIDRSGWWSGLTGADYEGDKEKGVVHAGLSGIGKDYGGV